MPSNQLLWQRKKRRAGLCCSCGKRRIKRGGRCAPCYKRSRDLGGGYRCSVCHRTGHNRRTHSHA